MLTSTRPGGRPHHTSSYAERSELTERLAWRAHQATEPAERTAVQREIVRLNIRVAHAVAARYRDRGVPLEDLEQVACEGLVKAVHRFDPTLHHDLLSYAVPTIRGEVLRHLRDLGWSVRPPRRLQDLRRTILTAAADLSRDLGREPTRDEICAVLGIDPVEHDETAAAYLAVRAVSLDHPVSDAGDVRLGDLIADDKDLLGAAEARAMLAPALQRLDDRDRRLLRLRFVEDLTQREIGEALGVSQMQVSRRLARICAELRCLLGEDEASAA